MKYWDISSKLERYFFLSSKVAVMQIEKSTDK